MKRLPCAVGGPEKEHREFVESLADIGVTRVGCYGGGFHTQTQEVSYGH